MIKDTDDLLCQILFASGDVLAQQAVQKVGVKKHDFARTGRMGLYGGGQSALSLLRCTHELKVDDLPAFFGPAATKWFGFLQNKVRLSNKNAEIAARVAVDQLFFAPANLFLFLSSMSVMEGSDPSEKLKRTYTPTLLTNWAVWPFVQAINFKVVPLEHRVLVVNVIALGKVTYIIRCSCTQADYPSTCTVGWNCYLSYQNSSDTK